jgi:hypothetical protein
MVEEMGRWCSIVARGGVLVYGILRHCISLKQADNDPLER